MDTSAAADVISQWPAESKEAAGLVIEERGEPDEVTESFLLWHRADPWKRIMASRELYDHSFPAPHFDCVQSVLDYRVPVEMFSPLAEFDGSVVAERTAGEISARCHDEQANFLALNLADQIIRQQRTVDDARAYYAKEFLDAKRGEPTPYMEGLRFQPASGADTDERTLSEGAIDAARRQGEERQ